MTIIGYARVSTDGQSLQSQGRPTRDYGGALSAFVMVIALLAVAAIGGSFGGHRNLKKIEPERPRRQPGQRQRPSSRTGR